MWPWRRVRLAGGDAHPVVPEPARHGHRHGDHGLWRRSDHRRAGQGVPAPILLRVAAIPGGRRCGGPGHGRRQAVCGGRREVGRGGRCWRCRRVQHDRAGACRGLCRGHGRHRRGGDLFHSGNRLLHHHDHRGLRLQATGRGLAAQGQRGRAGRRVPAAPQDFPRAGRPRR